MQLVKIGTGALVDEVFADGLVVGFASDQLLIRYALPAWQSFLMESYASSLDPGRRSYAWDELVGALEGLKGQLEAIRRAYRTHGNVDRLLEEALAAASEVLVCAAAASSSAGLHTGERLALEATLERLDYARWFDLLKDDLIGLWQEGSEYPTQDSFLVLNRHLERLLATGALFLWDDDGKPRVEVPHWSDCDWYAAELARG